MVPCKTLNQPRSPPTQSRLVKLTVKFSFKFNNKTQRQVSGSLLDFVLNVCLVLLNARSHRLDGERLLKKFPFSKTEIST